MKSSFPPKPSPAVALAPGVWQIEFGEPEAHSPSSVFQPQMALDRLAALPAVEALPWDSASIRFEQTARGVQIYLPLAKTERVYGLGLQLLSFDQTGLRKTLRVNSDPKVDLGDSHAPVPFYVSTEGYAVLVDTARYASFDCGSALPVADPDRDQPEKFGFALGMEALYAIRDSDRPREMVVDIPGVTGTRIFLFAGPEMHLAVQRYNLFSGGGCVPPRWALGNWYRARSDFDQEQVLRFAQTLREDRMPCDVFGLEPGWQSRAYACSHVWSDKFPEPARLIEDLKSDHFETNLWTHAFTHTDSPIYSDLLPHSGNTSVFGGIVPDFLQPEAVERFSELYRTQTTSLGVSGFKLDECDHSDFMPYPWSFPEWTKFPSGVDGEQMHCLFGELFQKAILRSFEKEHRRTFGLVRNSQAFAAPLPFVLYSDLYNHQQFVRGILSASFSGLLWCPEIREASSGRDLLRRLQSGVASPMLQINAWYIKNPPWKQWDVAANNRDEFLPDSEGLEAACRGVLELRMRLIPYLHGAFYDYWKTGIPPFRALVMDYPNESESWKCDDQILMGDRLMAAPIVGESDTRSVWFPPGQWQSFWTGESFEGGRVTEISEDETRLPLYVKSGSLLPLARPTLHTADPGADELELRVYGNGAREISLMEERDPSIPFDETAINGVTFSWNSATGEIQMQRTKPEVPARYRVTSVTHFAGTNSGTVG